jgi:hypothetical protein
MVAATIAAGGATPSRAVGRPPAKRTGSGAEGERSAPAATVAPSGRVIPPRPRKKTRGKR